MKLMFKLYVSIILLVFLTGCVGLSTPEVPDYSFTPADRLGLIVLSASSGPTHTHVGATIFNNYTNDYAFDWDIEKSILNAFTDGLNGVAPIQVIRLDKTDTDPTVYPNLVVIEDDAWHANTEHQAVIDELLEQGIKAVVVLAEQDEVLAATECGAFGCSYRYASGYGLFSRSFLGLDRFFKVNPFAVNVILLQPPVDLARAGQFTEYYKNRVIRIDNDQEPQKNSDIQEAEWALVKDLILSDFEILGEMVGDQLLGNSAE